MNEINHIAKNIKNAFLNKKDKDTDFFETSEMSDWSTDTLDKKSKKKKQSKKNKNQITVKNMSQLKRLLNKKCNESSTTSTETRTENTCHYETPTSAIHLHEKSSSTTVIESCNSSSSTSNNSYCSQCSTCNKSSSSCNCESEKDKDKKHENHEKHDKCDSTTESITENKDKHCENNSSSEFSPIKGTECELITCDNTDNNQCNDIVICENNTESDNDNHECNNNDKCKSETETDDNTETDNECDNHNFKKNIVCKCGTKISICINISK